jgi:hypothetical protein
VRFTGGKVTQHKCSILPDEAGHPEFLKSTERN